MRGRWEACPKTLSADAGRGGYVKKEVVNRKGKIKIHEGFVTNLLKNMIGRCWPGRLSQGDAKKELANRQEKIKIHEGSVKSLPKSIIG
jgi:hypothetical protein